MSSSSPIDVANADAQVPAAVIGATVPPEPMSMGAVRAVLCLLLVVAHGPWQFYLALASISVVSSFFGPAQGVVIRSAVPMHGLRSANALMQQVMFGMRIVGPVVAGFIVTLWSPLTCYVIDAASFIASGSLIASLAIPGRTKLAPDAAPAEKKAGLMSVFRDMKQGLSFIVHHAGVLFVILALAAGMFVLGCFGPLIAIYVRDSVHASTRMYGVASAMIGVGMFGGVTLLNTAGKKIKNEVLVYTGLCGIAAGLCVLTLLTQVWSTIVGDLMIGLAVSGIVIPANVMIQQETPHALMGRVGSTVMSIVFGAQIVGLVLSGILSEHVGVREVFALCAGLLIVLTLAGKMFMEPNATKA
jgi:DHA3 family macrolide efflux protein-like MFS transporter